MPNKLDGNKNLQILTFFLQEQFKPVGYTNDQCFYNRARNSSGIFFAYLLLEDPRNPAPTAEQMPGRLIEAPGSAHQSFCHPELPENTLKLHSFRHMSTKISAANSERHPTPVLYTVLYWCCVTLLSTAASCLSDYVYKAH